MGKLNRGNLLATLKKLKKMPRPKVVIANPAVQAICGGSSIKSNKKADLKAVVERRRALKNGGDNQMTAALIKFDNEFAIFMSEYNRDRQ